MLQGQGVLILVRFSVLKKVDPCRPLLCTCRLQLMPNRQRLEAVAQQYITLHSDPPWIEERYVSDVKVGTVSLVVLCNVV